MQALEDILKLFTKYQRTSTGYLVTCPIHEDSSPSLHIAKGIDGTGKERLLVHCFAHCDPVEILNYINSNMKLVEFSTSKSQPLAKETTVAQKSKTSFSTLVTTYNYKDSSGKMVYQVLRYANPKSFRFRRPTDDPEVPSGYIWSIGDTYRVLYNLDLVTSSIRSGQYVWKVEGEKDADALTNLGFTATCNLFGAGSGKWRPEYNDQLKGANLICVPDEDEAGYIHVYEIIKDLISTNSCKSIRLIFLPVAYKGDMFDYISSGNNKDSIYQLIDEAIDVTNFDDDQLQRLLHIEINQNGTLKCNKFIDDSEYKEISDDLISNTGPTYTKVSKLEQTELFRKAIEILEKEGPLAGLCEHCLNTGFVMHSNGEISGVLTEEGSSIFDDSEHQVLKLEVCMHGESPKVLDVPF